MDSNVTRIGYNMTEQGGQDLVIPVYEKFIETFILTAICIAAFGGNTSLWIIVLRDKSLRNSSSTLLLCLSAADWLVSVVNMPIIVYTIMKGDWMFSSAACVGLGFMTMLTFVASVMSLGTISFNRYVHICHPQKLKTLYTAKKTALWIAGTWILSASLASPPLFGWGRYGYLPGQSVCFAEWRTSISYTFFMVGMCFGGPCSAMTFCYVNILRTVRQSKRKVGLTAPISSATNSTVKTPISEYNGNSASVKNSNGQLHLTNEKAESDAPDVLDRRFENTAVVDISGDEGELNENAGAISNNSQNNTVASVTLKDSTLGESSPDNLDEVDSAEIAQGAKQTESQESKGPNISRKLKKDLSHDSTVRKSYRAGIFGTMGSNSSLDKDIQQEIGREPLSETGISDTVKRKLSFGKNSNKNGPSTGKKVFGNFLTVPGKKPLQAEDLAARRRREKERKMRAEEVRLTASLFVVIVTFVLCWLPFCCTMFWSVFSEDKHAVPRPIDMGTLLLGCANSMCNPIIYGVMNRKFRKGFQKLFCYFRNRALSGLIEKTDGSLQLNSTLSSKSSK